MATTTLEPELLRTMHASWRATSCLSGGKLYLYDNPMLKRSLSEVKPIVVGQWGTTSGQNFIYVHLNRVIHNFELDMFYIAGPGHGGPALVANTYLEGSYSEIYPNVSLDSDGMKTLLTQFSFPGGIPSHVAPTTPRSIHEGGESGYSLSHAFGAAFDNPGRIVACVIGDGEAETGPLATAWHSTKFMDRIEHDELEHFLRGCGWDPRFVEGDDPETMHELMATVPNQTVEGIRGIQDRARSGSDTDRPRWPMIVLCSPEGWTGPKEVDGLLIEHHRYINVHGQDLPEIRDWVWTAWSRTS